MSQKVAEEPETQLPSLDEQKRLQKNSNSWKPKANKTEKCFKPFLVSITRKRKRLFTNVDTELVQTSSSSRVAARCLSNCPIPKPLGVAGRRQVSKSP